MTDFFKKHPEEEKDNTVDVDFEKKGEKEAVEDEENSENIEQKLQDEIAKLKDTLIRKAADFDNVRKRMEREKADAVAFANTKMAKDLLPTIDNFRHIAASLPKDGVPDNVRAVFDGIELCEKGLLSVLEKHGIRRVETNVGDEFNHKYHQAMCETESDDVEPGKIAYIMQDGYTYNDRLLRPAMVGVAKKK